MTLQTNDTVLEDICELLAKHGTNEIVQVMTILLNNAMLLERQHHLQASAYERTEERNGYANGFKPKTLHTRVGELTVAVPQVRDSSFYPSALEKGSRSERSLKAAIAEMYLQGVSTRKVTAITKELCGLDITSTQVSRMTAELDPLFEEWRNRPLGSYTYVFFDARYESIRHGGVVIDMAVFVATGICSQTGKRDVLGVSTSLSEAEPHWRAFFQSLKARGLHGVKMIISDAHEGLKKAKQAVFPTIPWQRCQTHIQRNGFKYIPKQEMKSEVGSDIRAIFNAPDRAEADRFLEKFIAKYQSSAPKLADWAEVAIPEGLTVFSMHKNHRRRTRTTNMVERLNQEIKRRTNVARIFPNEESCLRLVTAILIETSEEWQSGKRYLSMNETS